MDQSLKGEFVRMFFRFRKSALGFPGLHAHTGAFDLNMAELGLMQCVFENEGAPGQHLPVSEIHQHLFITKAAVSQMLSALERKGYVNRDVDRNNRRRIVVTLTNEGRRVLTHMQEKMDVFLTELIERLGEDDTREIIRLCTRFAEVIEGMKDWAQEMVCGGVEAAGENVGTD